MALNGEDKHYLEGMLHEMITQSEERVIGKLADHTNELFAQLRLELKSDMAEMRAEFKSDMVKLRKDILATTQKMLWDLESSLSGRIAHLELVVDRLRNRTSKP